MKTTGSESCLSWIWEGGCLCLLGFLPEWQPFCSGPAVFLPGKDPAAIGEGPVIPWPSSQGTSRLCIGSSSAGHSGSEGLLWRMERPGSTGHACSPSGRGGARGRAKGLCWAWGQWCLFNFFASGIPIFAITVTRMCYPVWVGTSQSPRQILPLL
jgi:hypothetical protein